MTFSIITPSHKQLDWLRLCVASVRDQVEEKPEPKAWERRRWTGSQPGAGDRDGWPVNQTGELRAEGQEPEIGGRRSQEAALQASSFKSQVSLPLRVEHIIQDAGTPGIGEFAREIGADFYRDGNLVFSFSDFASLAPARIARRVAFGKLPVQNPLARVQDFSLSGYRIAVHCEPDAGMYDAINRGLRRATGELCAYLNCDEQYLPGALEAVTAWFASHPGKDVVFADALLLDAEGRALSYRRTVLPDRLHTRLCHLNTLTCSTFFRRSIIDNGHLFPQGKKIIGDGVWVDTMLKEGVPMGYLALPTSAFTFTGTNMSELDKGEGGEQDAWLDEPGAPPRWLRKPVSLLHRLKKLGNGAYRKRTLDYAVYSPDSPVRRKIFHAENLGSGWPGRTP